MAKKPLVITHGSCFDGFTAAWVFRLFKGDADFVHAQYGDAPPDVKGRDLWVLDFSYKRPVMKELILASLKTTVFDHHKTAEAELSGIIAEIKKEKRVARDSDRIVFDMNRSGAGITFDELENERQVKNGFRTPRFNGERANWLVDYIEDRDLWRFKRENSKAVSAWVASTPMTFEAWDALFKGGPVPAAISGEAVLRYMDMYGEKGLAQARFEKIAGHDVPTVNMPYMNCSEYVNRLLEMNPDAPFAAGYFRRADGRWQFSLRSREGFDVSEVAKLHGGGGHAQAAGFDVGVLPWHVSANKPLDVVATPTIREEP